MFLENLNNLSLNCFSILSKPVYFSQGNGKIQDSTWVQFPIQCKNFSLHISKMLILAITIVQVNLVAKPLALTLSR